MAIVLPGAYGKPRPALVIQSDLFDEHPSITVARSSEWHALRVTPVKGATVAEARLLVRAEHLENFALARFPSYLLLQIQFP